MRKQAKMNWEAGELYGQTFGFEFGARNGINGNEEENDDFEARRRRERREKVVVIEEEAIGNGI